jgi:hypothetical protein
MLAYDPSLEALNHPEDRQTVFAAGGTYTQEQLCCEMARLAYVRFDESQNERQRLMDALACVGFQEVQTFSAPNTDTQAFAAVRPGDGRIMVAFRGTQPDKLRDLIVDAEALMTPWRQNGGSVHRGFAEAFISIEPAITAWLKPGGVRRPGQLVFTGHSLGAALATLAATAWSPASVYTFGSPRVGDENFASSLATTTIVRFVDCCDLVTRVPPEMGRYVHVGTARYIDRSGAVHADAAEHFVDRDCMIARAEYAFNAAFVHGHVPDRGLADHSMANYLRAFF